MGLMKYFVRTAALVRHLFATGYHPERHYMRGPGPACARRDTDRSAHA